jgi:hypothetical protein
MCPPWSSWKRAEVIHLPPRQEKVLEFSTDAEELMQAILATRLIPEKASADAAHIAIAAVQRMDFLLTWNCRHIANAAIVDDLRQVCSDAGFPAPVICTPYELMV